MGSVLDPGAPEIRTKRQILTGDLWMNKLCGTLAEHVLRNKLQRKMRSWFGEFLWGAR